ncbi:hypothetical protein FHG87_001974 [Trinorchestia longiramus]|nr:hypothetical protein FHG87_001974 [Trinorchestia longiramus]
MGDRKACSESHGSTTNKYRDEPSFHRPMSKQNTGSESSDQARFPLRPEARRRPVRCSAQAAVLSQPPYVTRLQRSVSRTLYQALPKSTPQELSSPEELNTQTTAERMKKKSAIMSEDRMGLKQPTHQQEEHVLRLYTAQRTTGKMSVRQYSTSRHLHRKKKMQQLI